MGRISKIKYQISKILFYSLITTLYSLTYAQYRCDWNVFDAGGAFLSSTDFQAKVSVAQTAIGSLTGMNFNSFIGFWQIDTAQIGIEENKPEKKLQLNQLETKLYTPNPNPFTNNTKILFSIKRNSNTKLQIFDLSGREVRTLVDGCVKPGVYTINWRGEDKYGKRLAQGVYFLKFQAEDYQKIRKLLLVR
jgi:hypothetical protein